MSHSSHRPRQSSSPWTVRATTRHLCQNQSGTQPTIASQKVRRQTLFQPNYNCKSSLFIWKYEIILVSAVTSTRQIPIAKIKKPSNTEIWTFLRHSVTYSSVIRKVNSVNKLTTVLFQLSRK